MRRWCDRADLRVVTQRAPSRGELADLLFAWRVAKHVKSNAIVYAKDGATVGVGAGQMSRVDSTRIAARKAEDMAAALGLSEPPTQGSVVASDAFFPFADGLLAAAEAGATAVIQPGGSMRDDEVIAAADDAGLAMVFTGHAAFPALSPARHDRAEPPHTSLAWTVRVAVATFVLDQVSKVVVVWLLDLAERGVMDVLPPLLSFRMAWNEGINFGLFAGGDLTRWVLIAIAADHLRLGGALDVAVSALGPGAGFGRAADRRRAGQCARPAALRGRGRFSQHVVLRDREPVRLQRGGHRDLRRRPRPDPVRAASDKSA